MTMQINVDEYKNLVKDSVRLNIVQTYILEAIKLRKSLSYVSINEKDLIWACGITEEAKEANEEAEDRLEAVEHDG